MAKALGLSGTDFKGRKLVVDYATTPARKGYKLKLDDEGNKLYNKKAKKEISGMKRRKERKREKMEGGKDFNQF